MQKKKNFLKIVILGDSGVGKTTILQQYLSGKTGASKPTIGADFSKKEILIDNTVVTLQIWDTAGQEKFQSLGYAFYRGADCCALVYDITSQQSFDSLSRWRDGFHENAGPSDPQSFPFVCIGNKLDQEQERQVARARGEQWARDNNNMLFYETSAVEGTCIEEAFIEMAKRALKRDAEQAFSMPANLADAPGGMKLKAKDHNAARGATQTRSNCC